jgi:hypothetical protein
MYNVFIYIIIIIIIGFIIGFYLRDFYTNIQEGIRTLPKPTNFSDSTEYENSKRQTSVENTSLNILIDAFLSKYFDENNIPREHSNDWIRAKTSI